MLGAAVRSKRDDRCVLGSTRGCVRLNVGVWDRIIWEFCSRPDAQAGPCSGRGTWSGQEPSMFRKLPVILMCSQADCHRTDLGSCQHTERTLGYQPA